MRSLLYQAARLLGDFRALTSPVRLLKRIVNKLLGRFVIAKLWWR